MNHLKVLVTGSNGQVGHQLVQRLTGKVELLATDRSVLDISNQQQVEDFVMKFQPDVIINAAAYTAVDKAEIETEAANAINHLGSKYLAIAANKVNAALLHISTDYVFSGHENSIYNEKDPTGPNGVYGKTKLDGEAAVAEHCPHHIIMRTAWVFGEHGNNFVKTMLRLGQTRPELGIVADQFGGPTYAGDIADALISICQQITSTPSTALWGTYHYSGMPYVSWFEFARAIFQAAEGSNVLTNIPLLKAINTEDYPTPAKRPANSRLDCSKLEKAFGIKPSDWQTALTNVDKYK
ncbi:dTDP-4-dehydrorhamnose reductase [Rheinheimera sp. A13L]|uniref:dTDP-4-dehydrorhamnose reductase n=1 Tax=Rheinheimera sp. A13L TaxID=506534 RepID=UPI00021254B1|nr:dTDP-4-dehydrorhamnose reductase [Rheinheimera sp. A13L]EGM78173.1 dTDP-4-dehydrorhamnose reductase [Rheinheimera sp. A13L]